MKINENIEITNEDNMQLMARYPDNHFDLAVVDPEFGIGIGNSPRLVTDKGLKAKDWDNKPINPIYFKELFRVSKNQIIWGANYYSMPPTKHCIVWDKKQPEKLSFGMFDFAWTSFDGANKMFRFSAIKEKGKIHPTQKPVDLYQWIFKNYASPNMKIIDTHLGSGNIIKALDKVNKHDKMNLSIVACEIDKEYFDNSIKSIMLEVNNLSLF